MCNACGNICCGSDALNGCGCEICNNPWCWDICEICGEPEQMCGCHDESDDDYLPGEDE